MSIATFIPEVWSRMLLSSLKKSLVYAAPGVVNRDYEGEITEAGDTVTVNSVGRPTIVTYTPGTALTRETLTTAQRKLIVDQAKAFNFGVDDVDKRQSIGDGGFAEAMSEAAYGLRDTADQYVEALSTGVQSANALGTVAAPAATPEDFYDDVLVPLSVLLDEANVPDEGRYCVIPAWAHGRLLRDARFIDASKAGNTNVAMGNGVVGEAANFRIHKSNNSPNTTGDDYRVLAGHPMAISYAEQINKTEAYRPEDTFEDAVKGLHLYGAKLMRPEAIATAIVSKT